MDPEIKKQIIEASSDIRKKYNAFKRENATIEMELEKSFKPITASLDTLNTNINNSKSEKSTAKTNDNLGAAAADDDDANFYDANYYDDYDDKISKRYLRPEIFHSDKKDKRFGPTRNEKTKYLYLGETIMYILKNDDIKLNNTVYNGTIGLYELLFMDKPDKNIYTDSDLQTYGDILNYIKPHIRNGRIHGVRSSKYIEIISKLITKSPIANKEGFGILPTSRKVIKKKVEHFVYWDSANELVDRLRLLMGSRAAGHSGHDNEILSIIEELKESKIIIV